MRFKRTSLLFIALLVASCGSGNDPDTDQAPEPTALIGVTPVSTMPALATATPQTITRVGTASEATDVFELDAGPAHVTYNYVGPVDAAFVARLINVESGAVVADVADQVTPGRGETVVMIPSGDTYALAVELAEGVWQIDFQQPVPGDS